MLFSLTPGVMHSKFFPEGQTVIKVPNYEVVIMRRYGNYVASKSKFDEKGHICEKKIIGFCTKMMRTGLYYCERIFD
jgi:hypothetical protein